MIFTGKRHRILPLLMGKEEREKAGESLRNQGKRDRDEEGRSGSLPLFFFQKSKVVLSWRKKAGKNWGKKERVYFQWEEMGT